MAGYRTRASARRDPYHRVVSHRDQHPTARIQLAELHGLGTWPVALAALDALGPDWLLIFRRGVLAEIRAVTMMMEPEVYQPELVDRLDRLVRALRHLPHEATLSVPTAAAPAPVVAPPIEIE